MAVGLKARTLVSGGTRIEGQARLTSAPRETRGVEGKGLGALRTTLVDKAGLCCKMQGKKESQHWVWDPWSEAGAPQTQWL